MLEGLLGRIKLNRRTLSLLFACAFIVLTPTLGYAEDGLTEIFTTRAFQGSWEVINKFNWLGWLLNFIIGSFSFLGLFLTLYSRMISLLYLSSKNLWNNVAEVKEQSKGELFGIPGLWKRAVTAQDGTGADAFVSFFYGLLPNVKKYSDYGGDNNGNLSDTDNALDYMLKTFPQTVLLVFFLSLGFSGTLGQIYGTVVDGMTAVADNVVTIQLEDYVDKFFAQGNHYRFTLSADGTAKSDVQQVVAKRAYQEVVGKGNILDGDRRHEIGATIEDAIRQTVTEGNSKIQAVTGRPMTSDEDWKGLDVKVTLSQDGTELENGDVLSAPPGVFNGDAYIKITYSAQKLYGDYFNRAGANSGSN